MDFHLKQWRDESDQQPSAKLPRLNILDQDLQYPPPSPALPLFVSDHSSTPAPTKFSRMSYFSLAQWQELELQALIFRHMLAGDVVPPELLYLLKKSLLTSTNPYYPLQHHPHFHPSLMQSGYWGGGNMDPEPGRCRRTDGKKWRCSRDVVSGQKYCERHIHRGRNRSRKPVEIPTPPTSGGGGGAGGLLLKNNNNLLATSQQGTLKSISGGGGGTQFAYSGTSPPVDLLHLNLRSPETNYLYEPHHTHEVTGDDNSGGRTLRHFFDDWPKPLQEPTIAGSPPVTTSSSSTSLSISFTGNHNPTSDFSLKLSTGAGEEENPVPGNADRDPARLNWAAANGWGTNPVVAPPMGGPLAEALRSSASGSSPTSVLHQLAPAGGGTATRTSYIST